MVLWYFKAPGTSAPSLEPKFPRKPPPNRPPRRRIVAKSKGKSPSGSVGKATFCLLQLACQVMWQAGS